MLLLFSIPEIKEGEKMVTVIIAVFIAVVITVIVEILVSATIDTIKRRGKK